MSFAPPVEIARFLFSRGSRWEAALILRATSKRNPEDASARGVLQTIERTHEFPPGVASEPSIPLVDRWIRDGMLVEALAVLGGFELGGPAEEWASLLGELLAPVPAHAGEVFVTAHAALLAGAAPIALATLTDIESAQSLPTWAQRRLELLRWMLLDNAEEAPELAVEASTHWLAAAMKEPLGQRSIEGALREARACANRAPGDADAVELARLLDVLVREMNHHVADVLTSMKTVPVYGRPAAAMQLQMANFKGAREIYAQQLKNRSGDRELRELLDAVKGVERVLEGRAIVDKRFAKPIDRPPPPVYRAPPAVYRTPPSVPPEGADLSETWQDETRAANSGELPLQAFSDDVTASHSIPRPAPSMPTGDLPVVKVRAPEPSFSDVTLASSQSAKLADEDLGSVFEELHHEAGVESMDDVTSVGAPPSAPEPERSASETTDVEVVLPGADSPEERVQHDDKTDVVILRAQLIGDVSDD